MQKQQTLTFNTQIVNATSTRSESPLSELNIYRLLQIFIPNSLFNPNKTLSFFKIIFTRPSSLSLGRNILGLACEEGIRDFFLQYNQKLSIHFSACIGLFFLP